MGFAVKRNRLIPIFALLAGAVIWLPSLHLFLKSQFQSQSLNNL